MLTISPELKAHLASRGGDTARTATCWKVTRTDLAVFGFTDVDRDVVFAGITYDAETGYTRTDVQTSSGLNVDTGEIKSFLVSPSMTEDDLRAGRWDHAAIEMFLVARHHPEWGRLIYRIGTIGRVVLERNTFRAELRGMTDRYANTVGRLVTPACDAQLGDARCTVDLIGGSPSLTVTGDIDGVSADQMTLFDAARQEAGPANSGVAITGISIANPGVVTTATALGLLAGTPIVISGAQNPFLGGYPYINGMTVITNPLGLTFDLAIDTSIGYPTYTGGAIVTIPGLSSGFFDGGKITFTGGANIDLSMEVKSYVPGQITLVLPMPFAVAAGDTYSMHRGCNKLFTTCRDTFNNVVNFRGFPSVPGIDKLMHVGKQ